MSDLEQLIPSPKTLQIAGESISVAPLKIGQMPAFVRAIAPVMQRLGTDGIDWLALFGDHGENLLAAVAIAVGKPREWVDALDADEAIVLAATVIEVNADFFTRTVLPRLDGLVSQATTLAAGSTPSST